MVFGSTASKETVLLCLCSLHTSSDGQNIMDETGQDSTESIIHQLREAVSSDEVIRVSVDRTDTCEETWRESDLRRRTHKSLCSFSTGRFGGSGVLGNR